MKLYSLTQRGSLASGFAQNQTSGECAGYGLWIYGWFGLVRRARTTVSCVHRIRNTKKCVGHFSRDEMDLNQLVTDIFFYNIG